MQVKFIRNLNCFILFVIQIINSILLNNLIISALAWFIIPQSWYFEYGDKAFVYNSWRIYLTSCGIPILIGAFGLSFFPESPKFLMSQGRNEEALEVFKHMYSMNNNDSKENYPVRKICDELFLKKFCQLMKIYVFTCSGEALRR